MNYPIFNIFWDFKLNFFFINENNVTTIKTIVNYTFVLMIVFNLFSYVFIY